MKKYNPIFILRKALPETKTVLLLIQRHSDVEITNVYSPYYLCDALYDGRIYLTIQNTKDDWPLCEPICPAQWETGKS